MTRKPSLATAVAGLLSAGLLLAAGSAARATEHLTIPVSGSGTFSVDLLGGTYVGDSWAGDPLATAQVVNTAGSDYTVDYSNFSTPTGLVLSFDPAAHHAVYGVYLNGNPDPVWDNPIPEPASWALMVLGAGAAGLALRRRRAGAAA